MLGFMPSEIARLVFGYLQEINCEQTSSQFLRESPDLKEYAECLESGLKYPTTFAGKGLLDILEDYYQLTHLDLGTDRESQALVNKLQSCLLQVKQLVQETKPSSNKKRVPKSFNRSRPIFKACQNLRSKNRNSFTLLKDRHNVQNHPSPDNDLCNTPPVCITSRDFGLLTPEVTSSLRDSRLGAPEATSSMRGDRLGTPEATSSLRHGRLGTPVLSSSLGDDRLLTPVATSSSGDGRLVTSASTSSLGDRRLHTPEATSSLREGKQGTPEATSSLRDERLVIPETTSSKTDASATYVSSELSRVSNLQNFHERATSPFVFTNPCNTSDISIRQHSNSALLTPHMNMLSRSQNLVERSTSPMSTFSLLNSNCPSPNQDIVDKSLQNTSTSPQLKRSRDETVVDNTNLPPVLHPEEGPYHIQNPLRSLRSRSRTKGSTVPPPTTPMKRIKPIPLISSYKYFNHKETESEPDTPEWNESRESEVHTTDSPANVSRASPLNLAFPRISPVKLHENGTNRERDKPPPPVIPVIDLDSSQHSNTLSPQNHFLGVSSQATSPFRECPESSLKSILQAPQHSSTPASHRNEEVHNESSFASEAEEAWRNISIRKERLKVSEMQNSPAYSTSPSYTNSPAYTNMKSLSEKENQQPNNLPMPTLPSCAPSPYRQTPLHCSSVTNSPGTRETRPILSNCAPSPYRQSSLHYSSATNSPATLLSSPSLITPLNSVEPELPARYPEITSPRFALSQMRSDVVPSLTTPVKQYHQAMFHHQDFGSPKRKSQIPRRRLISSPSVRSLTKQISTPEKGGTTLTEEFMDFGFLEELINNKPFIEKLKENINRVKSSVDTWSKEEQEPQIQNLDENEVPEVHIPDSMMKDILSQTESDPVFQEVLNSLCLDKFDLICKDNYATAASDQVPHSDVDMSVNDTIPLEENLVPNAVPDEFPKDKTSGKQMGEQSELKQSADQNLASAATTPKSTGEMSTTVVCTTDTSGAIATFTVPQSLTASIIASSPSAQVVQVQPILPNSVVITISPRKAAYCGKKIDSNCTAVSLGKTVPHKPNGLRTILPSPKKDLLQRTLESLDIRASPVKPPVIETITTFPAGQNVQNVVSSEFGTCVQVLNQPIMSTKQTETIFIKNGKVFTLQPGQLYTNNMANMFVESANSLERNQPLVLPSKNNYPVYITEVPSKAIDYKKSMNEWRYKIKSNSRSKFEIRPAPSTSRPPLKKAVVKKTRTENAHVRTLNFGQAAIAPETNVDNPELVPKSSSVTPEAKRQKVVPELKRPKVTPEDRRMIVTLGAKRNKEKVEAAEESIDLNARFDKGVVYINSSGEKERVNTIDMSQLDLLLDSNSKPNRCKKKLPATNSEKDAAAKTLMTLAKPSCSTSKTKKDYSRQNRKSSVKVTKKNKENPPKDILQNMNIDEFLTEVHKKKD